MIMKLIDVLVSQSAETLNEISSKTNVMTDYHDIVIGMWIMANHNPKHFLELGTGTAGWPISMHNALNLKDTRFTLIEDMSWGSTNFEYRNEMYPKNFDELSTIISNKTKTTMNFEIFKEVNLNTIKGYDTLRIDYDTSFEEFENFIDNCSTNSVVFVDDFRFNISLKRVAYTMSLVFRKKLFPLWLGDQETAWVTNKQYRDYLLDIMHQQIDQIKTLKVNPRYFKQGIIDDVDWRYINTRGSSDLLFTTHKEKLKNLRN